LTESQIQISKFTVHDSSELGYLPVNESLKILRSFVGIAALQAILENNMYNLVAGL
jgi:hypothetical protein